MPWSGLHFFPHPLPVVLLLGLLVGVVGLLLRFVLVDFAYQRLGLSRKAAWAVLWATFLGSAINLPVAAIPTEVIEPRRVVTVFGMIYVIPQAVALRDTVVAVNVGGAVIPVLLVAYLLFKFGATWRTAAALVVVTVVTHSLAQPVRGVGIVMPPLVPAVVACGAALVLEPRLAPRTAFVAGTLGTLIGADLLNLADTSQLGAPVVSIGGAGTFDGVFVTGILAVLLAGVPLARFEREQKTPPTISRETTEVSRSTNEDVEAAKPTAPPTTPADDRGQLDDRKHDPPP